MPRAPTSGVIVLPPGIPVSQPLSEMPAYPCANDCVRPVGFCVALFLPWWHPVLPAQETLADRITFSGGWSHETDNQNFPRETATGLGISYGHRFRSWIEAEAGLFTALDPTGVQCASFGCRDAGDHYYWVPFGVRFIAPLYRRRIELSAGGGGLYEKYSGDLLGVGPVSRSGGSGYFIASAAFALDRGRHFWVGATPRWFLANASYARDRWLQISAEISFRFR